MYNVGPDYEYIAPERHSCGNCCEYTWRMWNSADGIWECDSCGDEIDFDGEE